MSSRNMEGSWRASPSSSTSNSVRSESPSHNAFKSTKELVKGMVVWLPEEYARRSKAYRQVGADFFGHPAVVLGWKDEPTDMQNSDVFVVAVTTKYHDRVASRIVPIDHPTAKWGNDLPALRRKKGSQSFSKPSYAKVHGEKPGYAIELCNMVRYIAKIYLEESAVNWFIDYCHRELREVANSEKFRNSWRRLSDTAAPTQSDGESSEVSDGTAASAAGAVTPGRSENKENAENDAPIPITNPTPAPYSVMEWSHVPSSELPVRRATVPSADRTWVSVASFSQPSTLDRAEHAEAVRTGKHVFRLARARSEGV